MGTTGEAEGSGRQRSGKLEYAITMGTTGEGEGCGRPKEKLLNSLASCMEEHLYQKLFSAQVIEGFGTNPTRHGQKE